MAEILDGNTLPVIDMIKAKNDEELYAKKVCCWHDEHYLVD